MLQTIQMIAFAFMHFQSFNIIFPLHCASKEKKYIIKAEAQLLFLN